MKRSIFKRQIPTILGLLILFIGAGAGVILVGSGVDFLPRAGPEYSPKNLQITNVTDRSFTVSWVTDEAAVGFIKYGSSPSLTTTVTDDRDQLTGDTGSFRAHHITVRGLSANTTYYFKIGSGSSQSLYDNQGQPYQVTTGVTLGTPETSETIYGKVETQAGTPAEGTVVYVRLPNAAPLSTLVKSSGSWAVTLSTARTTQLDKYVKYDLDTEQVAIELIGTDGQITTGTTDTSNDQPVPTITLGENFAFAASADPSATTNTPAVDQTETANSSFNLAPLGDSSEVVLDEPVTLVNPGFDGETITTQRPEIRGNAAPNTVLSITVESPVTYEDELTSDANGEFAWSPPADLEPGEHTVTLSWLDASGIRQFLTRTFVVSAQESNLPAFEATPSATPTTATTTPLPSPSPQTFPSPTPIVLPSPSPISTPQSTDPGRVVQPSTASGVPVAGSTTQSLFLLIMGASFIVSGFGLSKALGEDPASHHQESEPPVIS